MNSLKTGTTTVGMVCKDGIIVAADKKATMGYLVASKTAKKIFKLSDRLVMTIAGSVGDAQALIRLIKAEIKLYELQEKTLTTRAAATLLSNIIHSSYKRFTPEMVQLVVGGFDERGPQLFSLDPSGSLMEEEEYTFSGSGSVIAVGVLEDGFRKGMSTSEGIKLLARAIKAARERDVMTGGRSMDIAVVNKKGVEFVPEKKIKALLKG